MGRKHVSRFRKICAIPLLIAAMPAALAIAQSVAQVAAPVAAPSAVDGGGDAHGVALPDNTLLALAPFPRPRSASSDATTKPSEAAATQPVAPPEPRVPYVPEPIGPLGYAGSSGVTGGRAPSSAGLGSGTSMSEGSFIPVPDRWRIGIPGDYVQNTRGNWYDPYHQNVLKGDYPILGQDKFLVLTATSDTLVEAHRIPVPAGVSSHDPGQLQFFGSGHQQLVNQNFILSMEFFKGDAAYAPRDYEFRATFVENYNYVHTNEANLLYPSPQYGQDRNDDHLAVQELFFDKKLADLSVKYDIVDIRIGIQQFTSDFRGFLFSDNEPGIRLFGNYDDNRTIWNLAWFHQVEKDTNSGLNTFNGRDQDVFIANIFREDFIFPGYTAQLSFHMNYDRGGQEYDTNGFLVRPQPIGTIENKEDRVYYLGWAGDGHIGRFNITHQFYQALGTETFNPIAGKETSINAQFFATELSYDSDWIRYRTSFAYVSGDHDPLDNKAEGFDSIFDNPNFAGGGFNYFTRQAIPLTGGGTGLVGRNSFFPDLRTSKEQGQANFVNPGLLLYNIGADFDVTPKLRLITNASYLRFDDTSVLQRLLFQDKIGSDIGLDLSIGAQFRPLNNQNIIFTAGAAALIPGNGFKDIYTSETLYSTFLSATFTY